MMNRQGAMLRLGAAGIAAGLALTACSTTDTPSATAGDKVLKVLWQASGKTGFEAVRQAFETENPGVKLNATYLAPVDLQQQIRTQLAAGNGPDLFYVWPGNGNVGAAEVQAAAGNLLDLTNEPWVKTIPKFVLDKSTVNGKTVAFLDEVTGFGVMYNDAAMKSAGLTIPDTWSGVLKFCADAKAKGKVAFSSGTASSYETQNFSYAITPQLVQGGNPGPGFDAAMKAGTTTFDQSGWKEALAKQVEAVKAGCYNKGFAGVDATEASRLWGSGEALARIGIGVYVKTVTTGATFTMAPLPATDDPSQSWLGVAANGGIGVNAKSANTDLAKKFVAFFATPKTDNLYVNKSFSGISGSTPVLADPAQPRTDQFSKIFQEYIDKGKTSVFPDQNWPNPTVQQAMYTGIQDMLAGKKTPDDVLKAMQAEYAKGAS
jgi:raffinose/stachyose/melibiose transport system substrate-binding protein